MDLEQPLRTNAAIGIFFTKHHPIPAEIALINQGAYQNVKFVIATTSRLLRLIQIGALKLTKLKHVILDCQYEDDTH